MRNLLKDDTLLEQIEEDWMASELSDSRKTMLNFAVKLTNEPRNMEITDINKLREVGFSDRDILDIVEVTAYYAYVNRLADGLGVTIEDWISDDEST
ncbi:MAG: peroxidase [Acidimicrobiaceae bacterium]|nr:peroxidase [Acidimicrobiaceae bacterium]